MHRNVYINKKKRVLKREMASLAGHRMVKMAKLEDEKKTKTLYLKINII